MKFKPRLKKSGDLILANDWNSMQKEIKADLQSLQNMLDIISRRMSIIVASGITSHGIYVKLDWDVVPHVLLSWIGTLKDTKNVKNIRCYPYDISSDGFSIYALANDKDEGIVNWLAIGVV